MSEKRIIIVEKCQTCPFSAWKNINNAQETYLECQHPEIPHRRFPKMSHTSPPRWCPLDKLERINKAFSDGIKDLKEELSYRSYKTLKKS